MYSFDTDEAYYEIIRNLVDLIHWQDFIDKKDKATLKSMRQFLNKKYLGEDNFLDVNLKEREIKVLESIIEEKRDEAESKEKVIVGLDKEIRMQEAILKNLIKQEGELND